MKPLICNLFNLSIIKRKESIIVSGNDLDKESVSYPYTFENLPERLIIFPKRGFITIDSLYYLLNQKRSISFLNFRGDLIGELHPSVNAYYTSEIRRNQYNLSDELKQHLSESLIETKSNNQLKMIEHLENTGKLDFSVFKNKIQKEKQKIRNLGTNYDTPLLRIEAEVTKTYWAAIRSYLPEKIGFAARTRARSGYRKPRHAKDPFNSLLNYSYSLLESEITRACCINGFDPYHGFFHKKRPGLKALVYDVIEPFRFLSEKAVLNSLKGKKKITKKDFLIVQGVYYLTPEGTKKIIEHYYRELSKEISYKGKSYPGASLIVVKLKELSRFESGKSTSFTWGWEWEV